MVNLETMLMTLFFVLIIILVVYLLIRDTRGIEPPFNKVLKFIFILGLAIILLLPIWELKDWEIKPIIWLGEVIIGIGIVILSWEKFKEGYEESKE